MKFIEDLFDFYKNHLTGDEEDAAIIIEGIMQDFSQKDLNGFFAGLSEKEKFEMVGLYLYEKFRLKAAEEGIGTTRNNDDQNSGGEILH